MSAPSRRLRVAIVAGEPSGDQLGFKLMRALGEQAGGRRRIPRRRRRGDGRRRAEEPVPARRHRGDGGSAGHHAPADAPRPHPPRRGGDRRSAPRRARHHRQPRLHPSRRAARPPRAAGSAGDRLRQPVGLGLAAGPGAGDARLCRLRAGAAAVRAGSACAARRTALRLRRPSADRAARRTAAERSGGAPARRDAAARPRPARLAPLGDRAADGRFRRGDRRRRARGGPVRGRSADPAACRKRRARARRALAAPAAHRRRRGGEIRRLPQRARGARRLGHRHARARARRRAAGRRLQGLGARGAAASTWSRCRSRSCCPTSCSAKRRFPNSCKRDCQPQALATALAALVARRPGPLGPARGARHSSTRACASPTAARPAPTRRRRCWRRSPGAIRA